MKGLTQAGLADVIPRFIGETLKIPENAPLPANWDPADPCADPRRPYEHSHTFWADGEFNSYDQFGQEVDEGRYKLVDDHTFILLGSIRITMHYRVKGDTIMFDPVLLKDCTSKRCLGIMSWAVSVAMPGLMWSRVTSGPNVPSGERRILRNGWLTPTSATCSRRSHRRHATRSGASSSATMPTAMPSPRR